MNNKYLFLLLFLILLPMPFLLPVPTPTNHLYLPSNMKGLRINIVQIEIEKFNARGATQSFMKSPNFPRWGNPVGENH
jgi:hypothetical protein